MNTNELLAILLGAPYVADADHVLSQTEGLPGLAKMTFEELLVLPAVGEVTAARIKVASVPSRRLLVVAPAERPAVLSLPAPPRKVAALEATPCLSISCTLPNRHVHLRGALHPLR